MICARCHRDFGREVYGTVGPLNIAFCVDCYLLCDYIPQEQRDDVRQVIAEHGRLPKIFPQPNRPQFTETPVTELPARRFAVAIPVR